MEVGLADGRSWWEGGMYPLFTASPCSYRQLCCVPIPMEEFGVAFEVQQQHDVLLQAQTKIGIKKTSS